MAAEVGGCAAPWLAALLVTLEAEEVLLMLALSLDSGARALGV